MAHLERGRGTEHNRPKITYSSKLIAALNKFAGAISTEVKNPLLEKYGDAYDYLIKGDAHRLREETEDAIRAYEKAISINPTFAEAYVGMARCFRRKGDLKRAMLSFNKALSLNSFDKEIHLELAKCLNEAGMMPKGIHHFRQALKIDPEFVDAKFNLALCLELQGDLGEPTRLYEEILSQDPDFLPAYNNLGSIYMRQGYYKAAERKFRQLIDMAPDFSRGYLGLAISLDRSNRPQEALGYYEKLLVMKAHYRNREYIENRILSLRKVLGKPAKTTRNGAMLVRVK
jgi:tetratricopeptide (TPR) repeat protein